MKKIILQLCGLLLIGSLGYCGESGLVLNLLERVDNFSSIMPSELKASEEYRAWGREGELERDSVTILENSLSGRLLVEICTDGKPDILPTLFCKLPEKRLLSNYTRLAGRLKISSDYSIQQTDIALEIAGCQCEDESKTALLGKVHSLQGVWQDFSLPIKSSDFPEQWLKFTFEDNPLSLDTAHKRYLEITELRLEADKAYKYYFDGQGYNELPGVVKGKSVSTIKTNDGFSMGIDGSGLLKSVSLDGVAIAAEKNNLSGFMLKDMADMRTIQSFSGSAKQCGSLVSFEGNKDKIALEADFKAYENRIDVSGLLKNNSSDEKFLSLYFAIPVSDENWQWAENINKTFKANSGSFFEEFKHEGHYPLGTMFLPDKAALSIAVKLNEPSVYRIAYNKQLKLFYIAFDFALLQGINVNGKDMSAQAFSFVIYKTDPAWHFRSALERYYDFFPQFFTNRIDNPGGWGVWLSKDNCNQELLETGVRFSWGGNPNAAKWCKENGVYNLVYVEPAYYHLSMGDYDNYKDVTSQSVLERLDKLSVLDEKELEIYSNLVQWGRFFKPDEIKNWNSYNTKKDYWQAMLRGVQQSKILNYDMEVEQTIAGNRSWLGDSNIGTMISCNIDPDIPFGRGWFVREIKYRNYLKTHYAENGFELDGFALDSFMSLPTPNYNREHFKYADLPLSFTVYNGRAIPVIAPNFSSIEWIKDLRDKFPDKLTMANLTCCNNYYYMTFASPYLDIFGIEDRRVEHQEYLRAMAYRKPITDLPYSPREPQQVKKQLLYAIFQGKGHCEQSMKKHFPVIHKMNLAGWHPIPYAKTETAGIIIERYADTNNLYLAAYNDNNSAGDIKISLDDALNVSNGKAIDMLEGYEYQIMQSLFELKIAPKDTVVLEIITE